MRKNKNSEYAKDFLKFIRNPLNSSAVDIIYKTHNIVFERVDLFRDFSVSLNLLIQDSYLGDDVYDAHDDMDKKYHFDWCWKKTCEIFEKHHFYFIDNQELYKYFSSFFRTSFYSVRDKDNDEKIERINFVLKYLLNCNSEKQPQDMDTFIEIYKKFDLSFKIND